MFKIFLPLFATLICSNSYAANPEFFPDLARHADGSVYYMNHRDALEYCRREGSRLPSIDELVLYAESLGAKGIAKADGGLPDSSYYRIRILAEVNEYGLYPNWGPSIKDQYKFWFSHEGYRRPTGDLGNESFWSSTLKYSFTPYYLDGRDGEILDQLNSTELAVLCVLIR